MYPMSDMGMRGKGRAYCVPRPLYLTFAFVRESSGNFCDGQGTHWAMCSLVKSTPLSITLCFLSDITLSGLENPSGSICLYFVVS